MKKFKLVPKNKIGLKKIGVAKRKKKTPATKKYIPQRGKNGRYV